MKNKKILISGASIAGPTLAYWLNRYGFNVTIIERAPELRLGGQNIDVKGPAEKIAIQMGIEKKIREKNTTEMGQRFVTKQNKLIAEFSKESALSMTQELEILRGDLVQILYDSTIADVNYIFGDYITNLKEHESGIAVTFSSGKNTSFDLLLIAEGIGSSTRKIAFRKQPTFKFLGLYTAYLTIAKAPSDSQWSRWCNAEKGIVYLLRPDNYGSTRASITFTALEHEYTGLSIEEQKNVLVKRISGSGFESERLVEEIQKSKDLYFDRISQVNSPEWSEGRVAMIGDAAYCATPIAGKGTDLAMAGAYILAGELFTSDNYQQAFENYENKMRPYVSKCQKLPPGIPKIVYPQSKLGLRILNTVISIVGSKPTKWIMGFFGADRKKIKTEIELPDYTLMRQVVSN
ncbi:FAD-dependent monooxygenase [Pedobacter jeongneungensis]|uniref:FAD-dependent monooxygenase n=1 Tax=Pedobacter jeongneungensis TaxID=947309 RepID=UPI000469845E|nr:FAD-dependent monooxygenase [Pedobacter jeongneungensis]